MEPWVIEILKQTPGLGGVLIVLWGGKAVLEKMVAQFLAQLERNWQECHASHAKLNDRVDAHLAAGNALARELHKQNGEMLEGMRHMNAHLEQCAKLVERIHEDNMRLRSRDEAA